jgi:hypothetical protein
MIPLSVRTARHSSDALASGSAVAFASASAFVLVLGLGALFGFVAVAPAHAQTIPPPPGEGPALGERLPQYRIEGGELTLTEIRREGRRVFSTPFNRLDGYGDGPMNPDEPLEPGGRPTLQDNGMTLRVNGLDAQSCLECHGILSSATVPMRFGVGGVGGIGTNVMARPSRIDVTDEDGNGFADFDGRYINPPFVLGSGGVELLGKEMTRTLQRLADEARANPGVDVPLVAKGVDFGVVRFENGVLDTSRVVGVSSDLVVRPFGRKGEFATVREFATGAMQFHFGIQPTEIVGEGQDADGDGVADEILVGELSALHVFATTTEAPRHRGATPETRRGFELFESTGCADCHRPFLTTHGTTLPYCFPEVPDQPFANAYLEVDLTETPIGLREDPRRDGLVVPLFADLKRHDMGPRLAESTGDPLASWFTTARLWGVADTAPYMHDGRASTLTEAIHYHGGEARDARARFFALPDDDRAALLAFLRTLRTPTSVGADLDENP